MERARRAHEDGPAPSAAATLLGGRTIAIVGAGYSGKRFIYEHAASLGARLVLVDAADHWSRQLQDEGIVEAFLPIDTRARPVIQAGQALVALGKAGIEPDAVCTFWEDSVPVAARVARALDLPGNDPAAADRARSKLLTRKASRAADLPTPWFAPIDSVEDLAAAAEDVGFPAVLKPEFGASAIGVYRVDSFDELREAFLRIKPLLPDLDTAFLYGTSFLLEEYLDGAEFDVDLVFENGALRWGSVSDNWPTEEPYFGETGLHCPSTYPMERQRELVDLAVRTTRALGLELGVIHVEAKYTSYGPRIVEVNARMGGTIVRDMLLKVHGVDLVEEHLLASAGLPVRPVPAPEPRCGVSNVLAYAHRTGTVPSTDFMDRLAADPRVFYAHAGIEPGTRVVACADGIPTLLYEVALEERDVATAIAAIRHLTDGVVIPYAEDRDGAT
jgi:biotin carboxylase